MFVRLCVNPGVEWSPAQDVPCFMPEVSWDWSSFSTTLMDYTVAIEYECMDSHVGLADIIRLLGGVFGYKIAEYVSQLRVPWQFLSHVLLPI